MIKLQLCTKELIFSELLGPATAPVLVGARQRQLTLPVYKLIRYIFVCPKSICKVVKQLLCARPMPASEVTTQTERASSYAAYYVKV